MVLEGERIALVVGAHEDREDLDLRVALRQGDRERCDAGGSSRSVRSSCAAHLDAGGAEIDGRRLPFDAALLADPHRQRQNGSWRATPLGLVAAGASVRVLALARLLGGSLEARQRLLQAPQRDRLAHEVERAGAHRLLSLTLGRASRDAENRDVQLADGLLLHEVEPAHTRQAYVEEDRVGALYAQPVERGLGGVRDDGLVPDLVEELSEDLTDRLIVVDNQDAH